MILLRRLKRPVLFQTCASLALVCAAVGLVLAPTGAHGGDPGSRGTTLAGVIRDREGEPISRAFVQVEGWRDRAGTMPWYQADGRGRFEIKEVPEGPVRLRAVAGHSSLFPQAGTVVQTRGGARDLVVTLETGRELRLKVEPYDSRAMGPDNGARLVWGTEPGAATTDFRWAPIAEDGSIRFVQLPDKPAFEVWGRASVDSPFKEGGLVPGKEVKTIRPLPGLTISGKIVPAKYAIEERAIAYANAYPGFIAARGLVKADGTFVIKGLPEGEYTVIGELRPNRDTMASKTVRTGATDVVLDFREPEKER